jgi:hypothetical protein
MGQVLGSAVLATISVSASPDNLGPFHVAFVVGAIVAAFGCVAASFVRSTPRSPS